MSLKNTTYFDFGEETWIKITLEIIFIVPL